MTEDYVEQLLPADWMFINTYVVHIAVLLEGVDLEQEDLRSVYKGSMSVWPQP